MNAQINVRMDITNQKNHLFVINAHTNVSNVNIKNLIVQVVIVNQIINIFKLLYKIKILNRLANQIVIMDCIQTKICPVKNVNLINLLLIYF